MRKNPLRNVSTPDLLCVSPTFDHRTSSCKNNRTNFLLGLQNVRTINAQDRLVNVISEIQTHNIDIFCMTETWLKHNDVLPDFGFSQAGLSYSSWPRAGHTRGGGLAIIYKDAFYLREIVLEPFESFEHITVSMMHSGRSIVTLSVIYRSPSEPVSHFLRDFDDFLEQLCTRTSNPNQLIVGDFNIHIDDTNNCYTTSLFSSCINMIYASL